MCYAMKILVYVKECVGLSFLVYPMLTQHSWQCTCLVSKRSPVQSWPPAPLCGISSIGRASVLQTEGYRFESCIPHQRTITKTPPSRERRRMIKTRPSAEQGHIVTAANKTSLILVIMLIKVGDQLPFTLVQTTEKAPSAIYKIFNAQPSLSEQENKESCICPCSLSVEYWLPKPGRRVRFPLGTP